LNIIRAAPDAGMDWIDTAEQCEDSEMLVGRALVGRRDDVFIATKVAPDAEYGGSGFRPGEIRSACDASLERLRIRDRVPFCDSDEFRAAKSPTEPADPCRVEAGT
jgi:aryl-alcohol dehydrogenase-like predicted oxidoreductase